MSVSSPGIHHVTAISGPAQENLDFYADVLGLRFVKKTVNFDDPSTYHLYYGDETGRPGTIMTFFPWAHVHPGHEGAGMTATTAFSVPSTAFDFWLDRFVELGWDFGSPVSRFSEGVIPLRDPHGLALEIVAHPEADGRDAWTAGPVPSDFAICGFQGVALWVTDAEGPAATLRDVFGYEEVGQDGDRLRFRAAAAGEEDPGWVIDLYRPQDFRRARSGAGTIHHVAFRARSDADQLTLRERLLERGLQVTPVIDRQYFRSIYFRHPVHTGGVLFEIATDAPGFLFDESIESLGTELKLPPQHEPLRSRIEEVLPPLRPRGSG